jgi:PilZ domain
MTLSSMVLSRDWSEVSVLECILGGLHIGVDVETEPERARAKLARSKIDALIVDCDLDGTAKFLGGIENALNTVPLLIISSPKRRPPLKDSDATFIFQKPISVEQAVHTLSAARNLILDGRLRYQRHSLDLPAFVTDQHHKRIKTRLLNLSQGGIAIETHHPVTLSDAVTVGFALPGCNLKFKINGEVVWSKQGTAGVHFLEMTSRQKQSLRLWLAKQYLTH